MSREFELCGRYYDLLYQDKDYTAEADYVLTLLNRHADRLESLLEFGCGTGRHAELFAERGLQVTGVERSRSMFEQAVERSTAMGDGGTGRFSAHLGDAQSWRGESRFDAVISLFHVVSYQTDSQQLRSFFENAARHLCSGGLFLFDVWYGPAVLTQRPSVRVKRMQGEALRVVRVAEPKLLLNENVVQVDYQIFASSEDDAPFTALQESHRMRYFFRPEIEALAEQHQLQWVQGEEWLTGEPLSDSTWGACFLLRKP